MEKKAREFGNDLIMSADFIKPHTWSGTSCVPCDVVKAWGRVHSAEVYQILVGDVRTARLIADVRFAFHTVYETVDPVLRAS